ncbi:MAG: FkbM family methyltransferase [Magnetococcales bacterium]|nr:FkbM family methyltransferase [Magnetococcales bacterium]MBF0156728.1 FkbM family methyltransferase [Magnetococcales bacterium]
MTTPTGKRRVGWFKRWKRQTALYRQFRSWKTARSEIRRWDEMDQRRFDFYRQFLREGDLCFDIGANIGNRTKVFARLGAVVVAVEPQDFCVMILRKMFRNSPGVTILRNVLGATPGEAEIQICDLHMLSSMSREWIKTVEKTGRFDGWRWDRVEKVEMLTLDGMIARFGVPQLVKIDVEGYEEEVLKGLSRPLRFLSLEFTPEFLEASRRSLARLAALGPLECNYAIGESMTLALAQWDSPEVILGHLRSAPPSVTYGDIYVRFL